MSRPRKYPEELLERGVSGSVGDAYENALAESFVDSFNQRAPAALQMLMPDQSRAVLRLPHPLRRSSAQQV